MGILMDALYETWNLDPVHGERLAYTKIGLALLKHIDKKRQVASNQPAKRSREELNSDESRYQGRGRGVKRDTYERDHSAPSTSSSRDGRDTTRIAIFSDRVDPDRRRSSPPGRYGGRRRDSW